MPRWRIFILALALILSLPLRLAAAAPLPCHAASAMAATAAAGELPRAATPDEMRAPRASIAVTAGRCNHAGIASMSAAHAAGQCGMSALSVIGAGPAALNVDAPRLAMLHVIHIASDPAPHFLTSGIDRPPRAFLV